MPAVTPSLAFHILPPNPTIRNQHQCAAAVPLATSIKLTNASCWLNGRIVLQRKTAELMTRHVDCQEGQKTERSLRRGDAFAVKRRRAGDTHGCCTRQKIVSNLLKLPFDASRERRRIHRKCNFGTAHPTYPWPGQRTCRPTIRYRRIPRCRELRKSVLRPGRCRCAEQEPNDLKLT
eukprot:2297144-Rhodomonas_salina.1